MKLRSFVVVGGLLVLPMLASSELRAQAYPTQDIHFICVFPPGSGSDVLVRYFAEKIRPLTGRSVIVENKPGAAGNIGIEYVAKAKPDGHTILVHGAGGVAASMSLFKRPPVDVTKTIQLAATINRQAFMIVVDAKSPYMTLSDLTSAVKPKGEKASYATAARYGTLVGEVYKQGAGIKAVEINYKAAGDSLNDQLSGAVDFGVHDPVYALAQHREGRLRILAVSTAERLKANPDLPTLKELGVTNLNLMSWWAAMVPAGTPEPVVAQINKWFDQVVGSDETRKFLAMSGGDQLTLPISEAQELFLQDVKNWANYVKIAKIEPQG